MPPTLGAEVSNCNAMNQAEFGDKEVEPRMNDVKRNTPLNT